MNFPTKIPSSQLHSSALIVDTQWGKNHFTLIETISQKPCNFHLKQCIADPYFCRYVPQSEISLEVYYGSLVQKLKNLETQKILILAKSNTVSQTHCLHCAPALSWSLLSGAGVQHKLTSFCLVGKRGFHSKLEKARYQREQGKLLTLNDFLFRKHIAYFSQFI